jgi:HlyD family secretion protein
MTPAKHKILAGLGITALAAGVFMGLRPQPVLVEITTARYSSMRTTILEEGKTRIRNRYVVSSQVGGLLQRTPLRPGDKVLAGLTKVAIVEPEPSTLLTPRDFGQSAARIKAAEAALLQREAELQRAESAAELAKRDQSRSSALSASGAISAKEKDSADLTAAIRIRELRSAEFGRDVARFELEQARVMLREETKGGAALELTAPVNGVVLTVFEENARAILPGTPLLEIGNPEDLEVEIELLSADAVMIREGAPVELERWGGSTALKGSVRRVEPAAFTKTSALGVEEQRVRVLVDFNPPTADQRFIGDRFRVEGRIELWQTPKALTIPAGSLFRKGSAWAVFRNDHGIARSAIVEVGHHNGEVAEILSGLAEGEEIIIYPPDSVRENKRIQPRRL